MKNAENSSRYAVWTGAVILAVIMALCAGASYAQSDSLKTSSVPEAAQSESGQEWVKGVPGVLPDEVRIGAWGPQSGPDAPWGALNRGVDAFFQMVTANGGVYRRRIRLLMVDDAGDPAKTLQGVRKLVEEYGVFAFVGGVGTENGRAVIDYLDEKGIPWVGPASGSTLWTLPPRKNVFAILPPYQDEAAALVKYAAEKRKYSRIAMIYQNDYFGREGVYGAEKQLKKYNLRLVDKIPLAPAEDDLKAYVKRLKKAAPQVVIMWVGPTHAILLRREAELLKFNPLWMTGSALGDPKKMDKMTSRRWAGTIFTFFGEPPNSKSPLMIEYRKAFDQFASKGERWGPFFYYGFGLAEPMVKAMKRCGPLLNRKQFIAQMEALKDFKGILGRITFGETRRQGQRELFLAEALPHGAFKRLTDWFAMSEE